MKTEQTNKKLESTPIGEPAAFYNSVSSFKKAIITFIFKIL